MSDALRQVVSRHTSASARRVKDVCQRLLAADCDSVKRLLDTDAWYPAAFKGGTAWSGALHASHAEAARVPGPTPLLLLQALYAMWQAAPPAGAAWFAKHPCARTAFWVLALLCERRALLPYGKLETLVLRTRCLSVEEQAGLLAVLTQHRRGVCGGCGAAHDLCAETVCATCAWPCAPPRSSCLHPPHALGWWHSRWGPRLDTARWEQLDVPMGCEMEAYDATLRNETWPPLPVGGLSPFAPVPPPPSTPPRWPPSTPPPQESGAPCALEQRLGFAREFGWPASDGDWVVGPGGAPDRAGLPAPIRDWQDAELLRTEGEAALSCLPTCPLPECRLRLFVDEELEDHMDAHARENMAHLQSVRRVSRAWCARGDFGFMPPDGDDARCVGGLYQWDDRFAREMHDEAVGAAELHAAWRVRARAGVDTAKDEGTDISMCRVCGEVLARDWCDVTQRWVLSDAVWVHDCDDGEVEACTCCAVRLFDGDLPDRTHMGALEGDAWQRVEELTETDASWSCEGLPTVVHVRCAVHGWPGAPGE